MKLLCHRGHWLNEGEKNALSALIRAVGACHGVETDVRDCDGELVIAHDPPHRQDVITFDQFLSAYAAAGHNGCLALNIKADGLQDAIQSALAKHGIANYFAFDMSVPDTLGYMKRAMPFAARISEYETSEPLLDKAEFVWLDIFHSDWYEADLVGSLLDQGKRVAIVSPELHKRPHDSLWHKLKPLDTHQGLYLCTDLIDQSLEFFNVEHD